MRFTTDMNKLCDFFEKRSQLGERYVHLPSLLHDEYQQIEASQNPRDEHFILDIQGSGQADVALTERDRTMFHKTLDVWNSKAEMIYSYEL